jgi:casein kinase 1
LYLLKGSLPWQGLPGRSKEEKYAAIKKKKIETSLDDLCHGHPKEFQMFMEYCRALKFEQEPNYRVCLGFFDGCMKRQNFDGLIFDYTWKQNRLQKDKEILKKAMMNIIGKRPRALVVAPPVEVSGPHN